MESAVMIRCHMEFALERAGLGNLIRAGDNDVTYPKINPVAFHIGSWPVYWYGLMYLVGFLAAGGCLLSDCGILHAIYARAIV